MDLKSVIKTFAEAWAAASLKMEKSSSAPPLPLSPPWDTFPKIPHTFPGLPLGSGWSTQGLPMQNLATFKSMEAEQGMEGNYANELLVKMEMEERKTGLSWKKDENMNQKVGALVAVKKQAQLRLCKLGPGAVLIFYKPLAPLQYICIYIWCISKLGNIFRSLMGKHIFLLRPVQKKYVVFFLKKRCTFQIKEQTT